MNDKEIEIDFQKWLDVTQGNTGNPTAEAEILGWANVGRLVVIDNDGKRCRPELIQDGDLWKLVEIDE